MRDAEEIIRCNGDMVYRLAVACLHSAADAEDVFQEVFLRLWRCNGTFTSPEHEKAWLIRVTRNCACSLWRQRFRRRTVPLQEAAVPVLSDEESALQEALAQLPAAYRAVVHLHYYEGYATGEIATLLGRRPSTIRTQLTRARRMLATLLKGEDMDDEENLYPDDGSRTCR